MALIRALTSGSGGGLYDDNTFEIAYATNNGVKDVALSFKPKKIIVYKITRSSNTWADGSRCDLYDEDMDSSHEYRTLRIGGAYAQAYSFGTDDGIVATSSNGFTFKISSNNWDGTYRYVAVG